MVVGLNPGPLECLLAAELSLQPQSLINKVGTVIDYQLNHEQ